MKFSKGLPPTFVFLNIEFGNQVLNNSFCPSLRQKEIQDVAHKLKESNKSLCRNLKENPNVQALRPGWKNAQRVLIMLDSVCAGSCCRMGGWMGKTDEAGVFN